MQSRRCADRDAIVRCRQPHSGRLLGEDRWPAKRLSPAAVLDGPRDPGPASFGQEAIQTALSRRIMRVARAECGRGVLADCSGRLLKRRAGLGAESSRRSGFPEWQFTHIIEYLKRI